jgi:hypothetical protein
MYASNDHRDVDIPRSMNGIKPAAAVLDRWPPIEIIVIAGLVRVKRFATPSGPLPQALRPERGNAQLHKMAPH